MSDTEKRVIQHHFAALIRFDEHANPEWFQDAIKLRLDIQCDFTARKSQGDDRLPYTLIATGSALSLNEKTARWVNWIQGKGYRHDNFVKPLTFVWGDKETVEGFLEAHKKRESHREEMEARDRDALWEILDRTIDHCNISTRSYNCLKSDDIDYIGELVQKTDVEVLEMKGLASASRSDIVASLIPFNLRLGMQPDELMGWKTPEERDSE